MISFALAAALSVGSSMTLCDAAAQASRLSGWRYQVAEETCDAKLDTAVPADDREARSAAWFERDAALAGYLLIEGDNTTRVVARDAALLTAIKGAAATCKKSAKKAPPALVARVKRTKDGAVTTDIAPEGAHAACLAKALASAPLPEAARTGSTTYSFSLSPAPVRVALGGFARR